MATSALTGAGDVEGATLVDLFRARAVGKDPVQQAQA